MNSIITALPKLDGRGDGIRTHDLMVPNHTRYQLRYASILLFLFYLYNSATVRKTCCLGHCSRGAVALSHLARINSGCPLFEEMLARRATTALRLDISFSLFIIYFLVASRQQIFDCIKNFAAESLLRHFFNSDFMRYATLPESSLFTVR